MQGVKFFLKFFYFCVNDFESAIVGLFIADKMQRRQSRRGALPCVSALFLRRF